MASRRNRRRSPSRAAARSSAPPSRAARHRTVGLVIVAASIILRLAVVWQAQQTPVLELHRWAQSDMSFYDAWARDIALGDWLSANVRVPMHAWHQEVAEAHLSQHPDARWLLERQADRSGPGVTPYGLMWARWMRTPAFYQDPLYPYLVGLTYLVTGADPRVVIAWQLALGVLTNLLIWNLARRFFGDRVAVVAALLAVLSAPLIYYELILLRESPIVFAGLGIVWLTTRALDRPGVAAFGVLGLALGAACLLKSSFVLLAIAVAAGVGVIYLGRWRELGTYAAATLAGLTVALAPIAARNLALDLPVLSLASSGPLTFVASNEPGYQPAGGFHVSVPVMAGFLGGTDGGWRAALGPTLGAHSVSTYARLVWGKWDQAWHWREVPNNENFHFIAREIPLLGWLPVTFWLIAPLGLVGLALKVRQIGRLWPLYVLVATTLASLVGFYVLGRFRVALLAAVIPFAAAALVEMARLFQSGRYRPAAALVAAALAVGLWTGRPLPAGEPLVRASDWLMTYSVRYEPDVRRAIDRQDWAGAAGVYESYLATQPETTMVLARGGTELARALADMHLRCAELWRQAGLSDRALPHFDRADRLLGLPTR